MRVPHTAKRHDGSRKNYKREKKKNEKEYGRYHHTGL